MADITFSPTRPRDQNCAVALGNVLIELQKTKGVVQFTIEVGAYSPQTLSTAPATDDYFSASPIYAGYVTISSNSAVSLSADN